jgi:tRNA nucleotidyltransferase/poly(A) polymerase
MSVRTLPPKDRPISEQYRVLANQWADLDAAAHIKEEMKTVTLEQMKTTLIKANPGLAENKAERVVKSSKEWEVYVRTMCADRAAANKIKQKLEYLKMRHREWVGKNADARQEMRLGVGDP